jgi:dihydroorotate dehydrogenase
MIDLYKLGRKALFALDPETAHDKTMALLDSVSATGLLGAVAGKAVADPIQLMGLTFPNRVGLAAGLDKNAAHIDALGRMGFGFIEVGTVTPVAQAGNPKPRMFRLIEHDALINRLGFNNLGVDNFISQVQRTRWQSEGHGLIGLNIGKNAATPIEKAHDDYLHCLKAVYPHAAYVTVNISSPNTKNLRQLQQADELTALLGLLKAEQGKLAQLHQRYVPMLVKIAPDLNTEQIDTISSVLTRLKIDGVIATNTTLTRDAVKGHTHEQEAGGLSGAPVFELSNQVIRHLRQAMPSGYPIVGVGGILSGADAVEKIRAGANLVQLYTGLIYRGPALVGEAARAIATHCSQTVKSTTP